ncbi:MULTISPECIES: acetoin utilization AcuB family protein [Bacillus]|uniref:Acetoin utilization AcuB family protein n=1 Tax=Bacillus halotolerans TaxID=260554 RepID=A0ABY7HZ76_9BACI|nr:MULTISPECIES: acetoin utilization AcuB family protein [Bacillus]MBL4966062.1 acetoin utilization AcuB family protein [Bacillus halotolerans]MBT9249322.1 acetoin utilization AcuB family protein [Bacillus halotolerans]MBV5123040.1 acetoin utilization AcuB family protein [Bacillus halotolerans]MCC2116989.1 acetoin utilization AcuB family protein [Bacillus halotolerans]MCC8350724.1 acetoin utilization AcuB family protein [Bacillus sp. AF23]
MIVEQIMKKDVITLTKTDTLETAIHKLKEFHIRHLPVINEDRHVIGMITDRDMKQASPSIFEESKRSRFLTRSVESIMKKDVVCAHPLDFVEEISAVFYEHGIGCLPVVQHQKLIGILTKTDLLRTFVKLTGADQPGSQVEIKVNDITKSLADVSGLCQRLQVKILSVLVYPHDDSGAKVLVFRVKTMNPLPFLQELKKNGHLIVWPSEHRDQL